MKTTKLVLSIGLILCSSLVFADVINVPADQSTIQAGINAAVNSDTVLVQPGTYVENINFIGKNITVGSLFLTTHDTTYISSTIIDGNGTNSVVKIESGENSTAVLYGFTLTNGSGSYGAGGGINCYGSTPTLKYLLITGNSANYGGGVWIYDASPRLENVTITGNTAYDEGGGISCAYGSNPVFINAIHWDNSPQEIYNSTSILTVTYSDFQGGIPGEGNIDSDPLFVDPVSGNYHLQLTSPCLDAGDPVSPLDPDGSRADMGVYYFHYPIPPDADFTSDITTGNSPLIINFTDISAQGGAVIDEWYWDFGDGNNSSLQNPTNEYQLPGNYTVSLTVTDINDSTDTETKVDYLNIDPPLYSGPVWHISTTGSDVEGNGSELYPFATIQYGINISSNTDTVLVQPGTYYENINFNGKLIAVGSLFLTTQDISYISTTIIDGNNSGCVVTFSNGEDATTVLCGFIITSGDGNAAGFPNRGGGIYCDNSSPKLENIIISDNSADYGGGIYFKYSNSDLEYIIISNNTAIASGGGILCENSSPGLQNVTITDNSAAYESGGGVFCDNSNPDFENVTISNNTAANNGGGILCWDNSNPDFINTILWNDSPQEIIIYSGSSLTATYSDIEGGWTGTGNIDSDPLFVDPGNEDYHLTSSSPCINTGDPLSPLDPDNTIADMGAYYFHIPQHFGPVWHISTTGSDITGNGSELFPFGSIQHGINNSANTDTVLVYPGTYIENINFNGKLITVGSLFLTTQDTTYISSTIIDGNSSGSVVKFYNNEDSTAVLSGFTITNGSADYGGGIDLDNSSPRLNNLIITNNSVNHYGGGVVCYLSNTILQNITISDNSAEYGGGIMFWSCDNPSLENVIISGNTASIVGGGLHCYNNSNPNLTNVSIIENTAYEDGGGIYCYVDCNPSIENVTISNNTAYINGGGICLNNSNINLINSILWNDSPDEIYIYSGSVTATYSDIQGGWPGIGNISSDPLFVDAGSGDYHLQYNSPCIDTGDPGSPLDPDGTIADMGAYYFQYSGPVWYISLSGSDITGNGSEQSPFATIQHGIDNSANGDTVLVQPGTYVENINYNGKLITVGSLFLTTQDTSYISQTIIDGNNSGCVVTFESGEDFTTVLCGFTIANGNGTAGGGILFISSSPSIEYVTISGNSADFGGGIYCSESSPDIQNVTISGNTATYDFNGYGGGGISCAYSHPNLVNVAITGNSAVESGGGIHLDYFSNPTFKNVTIVDNSAANGGGIYCWENCDPSLNNVTISGNTAIENGGGIYSRTISNPNLSNSILWNNSPEEIYNSGTGLALATYSDIEGGYAGTGNINIDPLFANPGNGNYRLQSASPCIDIGDPATPLDPDGTIADMGAYYYHQHAGPVWHISTLGSDLWGNGTEQLPFATIQHGIGISSNSDTVLVHRGTYIENINFNGKLITLGSLYVITQDTSYISSTIIDGNNSGTVVTFENGEVGAILKGLTITNGNAYTGGGIGCLNSSSPGLENLVVSNNFAGLGGGVYCFNSSPILQNVAIVSNNAAYNGGGMNCNIDCYPSLVNVTISNNFANNGGGIFTVNSNPFIKNAILWNNVSQEIYVGSGGISVTFSDVQGGWPGIGNISSDPLFVDPGNGDYHLQPGSPCIDAGDPSSSSDPDGSIVDMGAYYFASRLNLEVFLQGPFNGTDMNIDLHSAGLIPTSQPYDITPWNYAGSESVSYFPANIVDWVLIELRNAPDANSATPATTIDQQTALLRNDGMVVNSDGLIYLQINGTVNQQLFVVISHRNHIDIMSAYSLQKSGGVYSYDFTTIDQALGANATISLGNGKFGMYSGDANADGHIDEFDKSGVWDIEVGRFDYLPSDLNLDSQSNNMDKNDFWYMNRGVDCQVPE